MSIYNAVEITHAFIKVIAHFMPRDIHYLVSNVSLHCTDKVLHLMSVQLDLPHLMVVGGVA